VITFPCFKCGTILEFSDRVSLRAECEKCGEDAHVCKNCKFYDVTAYNECREPQAEVVLEKERNNRCEYFEGGGERSKSDQKDQLMSAAEALFKKK
jgi:imidazole glycerol phosphate synthase subunit HisF